LFHNLFRGVISYDAGRQKKDKEMKDDWDSVSSPANENAAWDAVSAPAPQKKKRAPIEVPVLRKIALFLGIVLLLALSGGSAFWIVRNHAISFPNPSDTATARIHATATAKANSASTAQVVATGEAYATSTAQAAATATTEEQIYNQATGGPPAFSDPLTDDTNSWGVLSTSWGGSCAFTAGAYHLALSQPHYWLWCVCASTGNLNNFAFQVQVNIVKGNDGGIVFSPAANDYYRAYVTTGTSSQGIPGGLYLLYRQEGSQYHTLRYGFSTAIQGGLNQANVVTIVVENGSFYFYDNGQFLISDSVSAFSNGTAGVGAQSDNLATDVIFSNVKIWTL
jgi:hypothetical protein